MFAISLTTNSLVTILTVGRIWYDPPFFSNVDGSTVADRFGSKVARAGRRKGTRAAAPVDVQDAHHLAHRIWVDHHDVQDRRVRVVPDLTRRRVGRSQCVVYHLRDDPAH